MKRLLKIIYKTNMIIITAVLFCSSCDSVEYDNKNDNGIDSINIVIQNYEIYSIYNFGGFNNQITALAIDNQNNLWAGSWSGLAKFDGINWTMYDTSNSGLSNNSIRCISVDYNNNVWIGTSKGLTKFDGINWTVYNSSNSILPYRVISSLAVDKNNFLWIGCGHLTAGGILSYDGNNWRLYTKENSSLPNSIINVIHIDEKNNKWLGTPSGLVKIDNQYNWSVYTTKNSGLLFGVNAVTTDLDNNVWIGANELERLDFEHFYGGLQKFDGENWFDYRPHPNGEYNPDAKVSNRVDHLICDRYGYLLIATETEWKYPYNLSFFKNGIWKNLSEIIESFPINPFINDIRIDNNNTVWIATQLGVISISYSHK